MNTLPIDGGSGKHPSTEYREARKAEMAVFASRLWRLMVKKGWNQSALSRQSGIGRDMISGYIRKLHMPDPPHARRLADALGVELDALFPSAGEPLPAVAAREVPPLEMRSTAPGRVMLHVNLELPMPVALQVLALVQGAGASAP